MRPVAIAAFFVAFLVVQVLAYEVAALCHPQQLATITRLVWAIEDAYRPAAVMIEILIVIAAILLAGHLVFRID